MTTLTGYERVALFSGGTAMRVRDMKHSDTQRVVVLRGGHMTAPADLSLSDLSDQARIVLLSGGTCTLADIRAYTPPGSAIFSIALVAAGTEWATGDTFTIAGGIGGRGSVKGQTPAALSYAITGTIPGSTEAIVSTTSGTKTIVVGDDVTATALPGLIVPVAGTTSNNKNFTVVSATFDTDHTNIVVAETLATGGAAGTFTIPGGVVIAGVHTALTKSGSGYSGIRLQDTTAGAGDGHFTSWQPVADSGSTAFYAAGIATFSASGNLVFTGAATGVDLIAAGTGYNEGTAATTTEVGSGTGLTVAVLN